MKFSFNKTVQNHNVIIETCIKKKPSGCNFTPPTTFAKKKIMNPGYINILFPNLIVNNMIWIKTCLYHAAPGRPF